MQAPPEHGSRIQRIWWLIALCAGFLLAGSVCFAASDQPGQPRGPSEAQADQEIEPLLLKVEQQIGAGHATSPSGDNALETWQRVLAKATPGSAGTRAALEAFVARVRKHADDAEAAGRLAESVDFRAFGNLVTGWLERPSMATVSNVPTADTPVAPAVRAAPAPAAPAPAAPAPASAAPAPAAPAPVPAAATIGTASDTVQSSGAVAVAPVPADTTGTRPLALAIDRATQSAQASDTGASPTPAPGKPAAPDASAKDTTTAVALAAPATHAAVTAPNVQNKAIGALYLTRGDAMLAIKDISGARKFYEYAADAGNARAAMALAQTFDPAFSGRLDAVGLRPDPAAAAAWYRRAAALGDPAAATRLHALDVDGAK